MALKRDPEKHPNHERWLVSYGDLLTLLLAVFVVMYAMSQSDKKKVEEVAESLRESFGYSKASLGDRPVIIQSGAVSIVPNLRSKPVLAGRERTLSGKVRLYAGHSDFSSIKASIDAYLVKTGNNGKVAVEITRRGVVVSLKEAGFFDSGSSDLKAGSSETLSAIATTLNQYANAFRVEGHTDNIPIHSAAFRSNWELSTARATNVVHFLTESAGFAPASVSAVGYGEYRPISDNESQDGRARNRRVDIVLLSEEAALGEARSR